MTEVGLSVIAMWDCVKADFEANWVSTPDNEGYARLWAFDDEGDTTRMPDEDEMVALQADL